jgi:hypothetical protein
MDTARMAMVTADMVMVVTAMADTGPLAMETAILTTVVAFHWLEEM